MLAPPDSSPWHLLTRLGEAQIILPVLLVSLAWLLVGRADRQLVACWLGAVAAAAALTLATKVAFIGYGIGVPVLNFTGVSGHAMFAAVVYPLLACLLAVAWPTWLRRTALLGGVALAALIAVSRVMVGAHSASEAVAGFALGSLASAMAMAMARQPAARPPVWLPLGLVLWLGVTPVHAPASNTHSAVTRVALSVSGRAKPYTRGEMLRDWQRRQCVERGASWVPPPGR